MLVNRYVPHYQRIPAKLTKNDFKMFVQQPLDTDEEKEKFDRMKDYIEEFDHVLVGSLMGDREKKFNSIYKQTATFSMNTTMSKEDKTNDQGYHNSCHPRKKEKEANKIKDVGVNKAGYDSDEERQNAHEMFVNDLQQLRQYFIKFLADQLQVQDDLVSKFNKERRIFLDDKAKGKNNEDDLKSHIEQLEKEIQDERDYSLRVWADE